MMEEDISESPGTQYPYAPSMYSGTANPYIQNQTPPPDASQPHDEGMADMSAVSALGLPSSAEEAAMLDGDPFGAMQQQAQPIDAAYPDMSGMPDMYMEQNPAVFPQNYNDEEDEQNYSYTM